MQTLDKAKLIEIAKKKLKSPKKKKANSDIELVNHFIIAEKIKAHDTIKIEGFLIYDKFENWAKINGQKIIPRKKFSAAFIKFFKKKVSGDKSFYFISPEGFNLNPTYVESVRQKWISLNEKAKKKEKKDPPVQT